MKSPPHPHNDRSAGNTSKYPPNRIIRARGRAELRGGRGLAITTDYIQILEILDPVYLSWYGHDLRLPADESVANFSGRTNSIRLFLPLAEIFCQREKREKRKRQDPCLSEQGHTLIPRSIYRTPAATRAFEVSLQHEQFPKLRQRTTSDWRRKTEHNHEIRFLTCPWLFAVWSCDPKEPPRDGRR